MALLTSPHQAGLVQQPDQIVARFAITIYPYPLARATAPEVV
jgi:hypothetical protein